MDVNVILCLSGIHNQYCYESAWFRLKVLCSVHAVPFFVGKKFCSTVFHHPVLSCSKLGYDNPVCQSKRYIQICEQKANSVSFFFNLFV